MVRAPLRARRPGVRAGTAALLSVLLASLGVLAVVPSVTSAAPAGPSSIVVAYGVAPPSGSGPNPYPNGMAASLALGQANLTLGYPGGGPMNLSFSEDLAFDPSTGFLFVVDGQGSRVVEYVPPFSTGEDATVAIGQASLVAHVAGVVNQSTLWEPDGLAFDARGNLWVADTTNNRVLEFVPPFKTGMLAATVLGQPNFTSRVPATTSAGLHYPAELAFDAAGDLWVSDLASNRVLEYRPPFTNGMPASLVLGQTSFTGSAPGTSATALSSPTGLAFGASGELWVADEANNRTLEFVPPFANGSAASVVLGQAGFTTSNEGLPYGMTAPWGLAFDATGDLWVSQAGPRNRVTEFRPPFTTNETPSVVIGQTTFAKELVGTSATLLRYPRGVAVDPTDDLWVSDTGNSRVLEFVPTAYSVGFAETGLPAGTTWSVTFDGLTAGTNAGGMTFQARNGSYAFTVGSVGGYANSPTSGTVVVNGSSVVVAIAYTGTFLGLPPTVLWPVLALLLALVALVEAFVLLRRRKRRTPPPPPLTPAAPAEPPKPPA